MITTAVLSLSLWTQVMLPGSHLTVEQAALESNSIVVARVARYEIMLGLDASTSGTCRLDLLTPLWNGDHAGRVVRFGIQASGREELPPVGDSFLFFLGSVREEVTEEDLLKGVSDPIGRLIHAPSYERIIKVEPDTPATRAAIRERVHRPHASRVNLSLADATTCASSVVVGTPRMMASIGAGGFGGSLYRIAPTAVLKGSARVGRFRLFSTSGSEDREMSLRLGGQAIYCFGRFGGGDQLIKTFPDTAANRAEIDLVSEEIRWPGDDETIAHASARSHAIVVGHSTHPAIQFGLGAVAYGMYDYESVATLKGAVPVGGWKHLAARANGREQLPPIGRESIIFVGKFTASDQAVHDCVVKVLPMSPANVEAVKRAVGATTGPDQPSYP